MTPHQAFTLWEATFGGGEANPRPVYSALFDRFPPFPWDGNLLYGFGYLDKPSPPECLANRRTAAAHLREWADALEAE